MSLNINILLLLQCLKYRLKLRHIGRTLLVNYNTNAYRYFEKQNCQSVASTREP